MSRTHSADVKHVEGSYAGIGFEADLPRGKGTMRVRIDVPIETILELARCFYTCPTGAPGHVVWHYDHRLSTSGLAPCWKADDETTHPREDWARMLELLHEYPPEALVKALPDTFRKHVEKLNKAGRKR